jgi:hypothetical protein
MRGYSLLIATMCTALLTSCSTHTFVVAQNCNSSPALAREFPSPSGKLNAVERHFDCPGWYTSIIDISSAEGTIKAVAFNDRPVAQKRPPQWPELKIEWKSDQELWVTYPGGQDTTCTSTAAGVNVHCIDGTVLR